MVANPSAFNPVAFPVAAKHRRDLVLQQMLQHGPQIVQIRLHRIRRTGRPRAGSRTHGLDLSLSVGGENGEDWYKAGYKLTKPNTWNDAIACAEWLVANKNTSPSKLGIWGGSAGGIFVGRSITDRPDLFASARPACSQLL